MPDAKKLFEALVREHADMLTVYLRSAVGNQTDVDDLFQETMVIAWRRLDDFDNLFQAPPASSMAELEGAARRPVRRRGRI